MATALMGIAVAALMGGLSGSLRNLSRAEGHEKAVLVARAQMNRLLVESELRPGRLGGQWDRDYRWEADVRRWDPAGGAATRQNIPLPPLVLVTLTVYWKTAGAEKHARFETCKYEPRLLP